MTRARLLKTSMPIIHTNYAGYILPTGRVQRYGNFLASGDSGYFPRSDDDLGQYDTTVVLPVGERVVFDVNQDQFGSLSAVNIVPE